MTEKEFWQKQIRIALETKDNEKLIKILEHIRPKRARMQQTNQDLANLFAFHANADGLMYLYELGENLSAYPELLSNACKWYYDDFDYLPCINFLINHNVGINNSQVVEGSINYLNQKAEYLKYLGKESENVILTAKMLSKCIQVTEEKV